MAKNGLRIAVLILLLIGTVLSGCRGADPSGAAAVPATAAVAPVSTGAAVSTGVPDGAGRTWTSPIDMQPIVDNFLAGMPDGWGLLPAQTFAAKQSVMIDVRQPEEYAQGHIEGAVNIPLRDLTRNLAALPAQDQQVALVCDTGMRAALGMVTLQMLGWKQARSIYGGLKGWQDAKLSLVTGPAPKQPAGNQGPKVDAQLLAALDGYLNQGLPQDYGRTDSEALNRAFAQTPFDDLVDPEVWIQGPPFVIDVSQPDEFSKGSLGGAVNMPLRDISASLDKIPWTTPTVVVCGVENELTTLDRTYKYIVTVCPNGHRSAIALMMLQLLGFRDVHTLDGGLKAWRAAGNK